MPDIDGLEVIRQSHLISPATRTILMTAHDSPKLHQEAEKLGAFYLSKPFDIADVVTSILNKPD